jgi:hypothetical protein
LTELRLADECDVDRARGHALRALGLLRGGESGLRDLQAAVQAFARSPARVEHGWAHANQARRDPVLSHRPNGPGEVVAPAPRGTIPVWVRSGSIVVAYPADHVASGLDDTPEHERPLEATLWGEPRPGRAAARLTDGTTISWRRGRWSADRERDVTFGER